MGLVWVGLVCVGLAWVSPEWSGAEWFGPVLQGMMGYHSQTTCRLAS